MILISGAEHREEIFRLRDFESTLWNKVNRASQRASRIVWQRGAVDLDPGYVIKRQRHQLRRTLRNAAVHSRRCRRRRCAIGRSRDPKAAIHHGNIGARGSRHGYSVSVAVGIRLEIDSRKKLEGIGNAAIPNETEVVHGHSALQIGCVALAVYSKFLGTHGLRHVDLQGVEGYDSPRSPNQADVGFRLLACSYGEHKVRSRHARVDNMENDLPLGQAIQTEATGLVRGRRQCNHAVLPRLLGAQYRGRDLRVIDESAGIRILNSARNGTGSRCYRPHWEGQCDEHGKDEPCMVSSETLEQHVNYHGWISGR